MKRKLIIVPFITFILLGTSVHGATFTGKVIDADTKEPIEGAVVVAYWMEERGDIAGPSTRLKDVKEILTDKNGEWMINGPKGSRAMNSKLLFTFITRSYYTRQPLFIVYKPGYCSFPESFSIHDCFRAYPYVGKQRIMKRTKEGTVINVVNIEGIALSRGGVEEKRKRYSEEDRPPAGSIPIVPVKDPERKLRNLDFDFRYPDNFDNVRWIGLYERKDFKEYTVVGLRKLKTREDRLRASRIGPIYSYDEREKKLLEKQKELIRLLEQEDKYLWPTKNTGDKNEK